MKDSIQSVLIGLLLGVNLSCFIFEEASELQQNQEFINDLLYKSIENNDLESLELLMQNGADIESRNFMGETPLHYAIIQIKIGLCDLSIIKSLLKYNPSVNDTSWINSILHILSSSSVKCNDEENKIRIEVIKLLLNCNLDINIIDCDGYTPLHCAIRYGNLKIAQFLIDLGANLNFQNSAKGYDTPLHLAMQKQNYDAVKLLIYNGANIRLKNSEGESLINYASKFYVKNYPALAKILNDFKMYIPNTLEYLSNDLEISKDIVSIIMDYTFNFPTRNSVM